MKFIKLKKPKITTTDGEFVNVELEEAYLIKDDNLVYDLLAYKRGTWGCLAVDDNDLYDDRFIVNCIEGYSYIITFDHMTEVTGHKYDVMECKITSCLPYGYIGFNGLMDSVCDGLLEE